MPIGGISNGGDADHSTWVRTPTTRSDGWLPRTLTDWLTGAARWRDGHHDIHLGIHWTSVIRSPVLQILAVVAGALPLVRGAGLTGRPRQDPSPAVFRSPDQASTSDRGCSLTFTA
ncbi:hypothetical protein [Protofrankia coriariae]|uniref:hypothetical protein n=1 Tax=Protofrankia coriariae TaxID=1562887 RepID=UPI00069B6230|nr:hypothetical protein [Protofrankia coriariae]